MSCGAICNSSPRLFITVREKQGGTKFHYHLRSTTHTTHTTPHTPHNADDVPVISRNDPNTWGAWPKLVGGILGNEIAAGPQAWSNRQHPRVHQVFAHLLATEKLIAGIDRFPLRPTTLCVRCCVRCRVRRC